MVEVEKVFAVGPDEVGPTVTIYRGGERFHPTGVIQVSLALIEDICPTQALLAAQTHGIKPQPRGIDGSGRN